jgi:hypothetical protein
MPDDKLAAALHPLPVCPECLAGKHGNCDGSAWNDAADDLDRCHCPNAAHGPAHHPSPLTPRMIR